MVDQVNYPALEKAIKAGVFGPGTESQIIAELHNSTQSVMDKKAVEYISKLGTLAAKNVSLKSTGSLVASAAKAGASAAISSAARNTAPLGKPGNSDDFLKNRIQELRCPK